MGVALLPACAWRMSPLWRCLALLAWVVLSIDAFAAPDVAETVRAHALFDRYWQESAERFPEWATWRGDHRFDDRFNDASESGEASNDAWTLGLLNAAREVQRDALGPTDQISLDLFIHDRADEVAMQRFVGYRHMAFGSSWGFQSLLPELLRAMVVRDPARAEQALLRFRGYAKRVDQEIESARRAAALGWIQPRPVLERTVGQIDAQLAPATGDDHSQSRSRSSTTQRCARGSRARSSRRYCRRNVGCAPTSRTSCCRRRPRRAVCPTTPAVPRSTRHWCDSTRRPI